MGVEGGDCIVIGGGLLGMLSARELQSRGAKVILLERGEVGREASWAGGGILSPLHPWHYPDAVTDLLLWSQPRYMPLAEGLREESGIDPEWRQSGLLILAPEDPGAARAWADRVGVQLESLAPEAVTAVEPRVSSAGKAALWLPEVAQVRNPRLVRSLRASLMARGVGLREHQAMTGLCIEGGRIRGVMTSSGRLDGTYVVLAAGAWTSELLEGFAVAPQVVPVRGQMIMFRGEPGRLSRIVLHGQRYLIPRCDGRILAGSTVEYVGFDKTVSEAARADLWRMATGLMPELADRPLERHWAGLRPGISRQAPLIGPHPDVEGLYINTGHFRNGVCLAPASARLLADLVTGTTPIVDPAPYKVQSLGR